MQGYLIDKNGTEYELPELLSWDICHGLGEPCDYFEVTVLYDTEMLTELYNAVRFRAKNGNDTVFYGVVDEYIINIDESGSAVSINGRSLAALLMDNELPKCTHYSLSRDTLLSNYRHRAVYPARAAAFSGKGGRQCMERAEALLPQGGAHDAEIYKSRKAAHGRHRGAYAYAERGHAGVCCKMP